MPRDSKTNLFISYAHDDKPYFDIFLKNLSSQIDKNSWNIWTDRNIEIGKDWNESIQKSMEQSDVAVLLISPDFLSSPFIKEEEFKKFSELNDRKPSFVFAPIFLRDCDFTRWADLSKLQMFSSLGGDYGIVDKKTKLIPFAELCRFDINGQLIPNPNIDTYFKNLVNEIERDLNINKSQAESTGVNYIKAKGIERLRSQKDIFLSLPSSKDGIENREKYIKSSDDKLKFDPSKWTHKITPGIDGVKELPTDFIYSIFIIGSEEDLRDDKFNIQYALAKQANSLSGLPLTILWFLNEEAKSALEKRPNNLELSQYPNYVGTDYTYLDKLIEDFDRLIGKKINDLSTSFSPSRKIYMFFDDNNDNKNNLRVLLKTKLLEDSNFKIRHVWPATLEEEKKEIEECQGAVIFYGSKSDTEWYGPRENITLKAKERKNNYAAAVCVEEEPEIEKKIKTDVAWNELTVIKGEKDLDTGLADFKNIFKGD